jgi:D-alanyl-D-alanine carboxypeptidase/D-alanyl-D-alanine-endopeptidase (penicillin-binding protein 4)
MQPVEAKAPTLAHRVDAPMNPASLMKLVTTLVALETLGPAYTFRTEALADAAPENGILAGNLYLRGSGDPKLTYDRLWLLLRELRGRGLREIRGDLVLDRSAFVSAAHDPAAFDSKPLRPYNVGPDALLFNFATLHLTLIPPDTTGGVVRVIAEPLPAGLAVVNRLRITDARQCSGEWREALSAQFGPGQLILSGDYPRVCGEKRWHLAGLPNMALLHGTFARLWRELGGEFSGGVREGIEPQRAVSLAYSDSPPLAELVRDINKFSNNVMARQVFLKLGNGEQLAAEQAVRAWLAKKGLDFPELVLDNGAGLSRSARLSAGSLIRLLAAGWASPAMPEYLASLPIAAIDGTVKKKFNGNGAAGQAHLKTGSLEGVRAIAGYLLDRHGRRHLVVFLVNHENAARAQPAFDALLEWLWSGAS